MILTNVVKAELVQCNASDLLVARAAWVSNFGEDAREKDGERVAGLIKYLYKNRHMSPFEHGDFTFFIDCPIFVAREFMRHRTFRFNEVSGRYSELKPKFYLPDEKRNLVQSGKVGAYNFTPGNEFQIAETRALLRHSYEQAWHSYITMKKSGIANEVARDCLPVGIYTQFYASVNPRNLMHFLGLRTDPQALYEIRMVADAMEIVLSERMPLTYAAYKDGKDA